MRLQYQSLLLLQHHSNRPVNLVVYNPIHHRYRTSLPVPMMRKKMSLPMTRLSVDVHWCVDDLPCVVVAVAAVVVVTFVDVAL